MPIVKCAACGKIGFVVRDPPSREAPEGRSWERKPCSHCGKRKLKRAVFGVDYGFKDDGKRYGVPEWKEERQKSEGR
jgi:hypothetical protein